MADGRSGRSPGGPRQPRAGSPGRPGWKGRGSGTGGAWSSSRPATGWRRADCSIPTCTGFSPAPSGARSGPASRIEIRSSSIPTGAASGSGPSASAQGSSDVGLSHYPPALSRDARRHRTGSAVIPRTGSSRGSIAKDRREAVTCEPPGSARPSYDEWTADKIKKLVPLNRWQEPEDIAAMAVFLASNRGRNMAGQTINGDGGYVMQWCVSAGPRGATSVATCCPGAPVLGCYGRMSQRRTEP